MGAQQLMLDFTTIKAMLLDLPNVRRAEKVHVPTGYARHVSKEMAKAEQLLKVVLTPTNALVETYKALVNEGSESEFAKILDLKVPIRILLYSLSIHPHPYLSS